MTWVRRIALGLILVLAVARLLVYLVCAFGDLTNPFESFHLEAKMVLLAYRVQAGDRLYPPWRDYPHVANFFGPVYFTIVGLVGRLTSATIADLFTIGRLVTFTAALGTSALTALWLRPRYGGRAALVGAILSLGSAPMFGFSTMVRADLLAEFFGTAGFLVCVQGSRLGRWRLLGSVLLGLAVLTKQTTAVFLAAAVLALLLQGARREALLVFALGVGLTLVSVGAITWGCEPRFVTDFLGEGKTPWAFASWWRTLERMIESAPDLLLAPWMALLVARVRGDREPGLLALSVVLTTTGLATSAKLGADLNYYLSLRVCEGVAGGILWRSLATAGSRKEFVSAAVAAGVVIAALVPSIGFALPAAVNSLRNHELQASSAWPAVRHGYDRLIQTAERPDVELLTDSGLLDLHRRERAAFGDPWMFRMLVETGRIQPTRMKEWIESEKYDIVVTTSDLMLPAYRTYDFGLPMVLVESIRTHYVPAGRSMGFFLYARRGTKPSGLPPAPAPPER